MNDRCPRCYRRLPSGSTESNAQLMHELSGECRAKNPPKAKKPKKSKAGYVPPSRSGRMSWSEYLAGRASTPEEKREKARLRQQRYRARQNGVS